MTNEHRDLLKLLGNEGKALQAILFKYNTEVKELPAKESAVDASMTAQYVIGELFRNN